jgi:hypothetical protein
VKADAAMRAFNAAGAGIVRAATDSGVDIAHLHFGSQDIDRVVADHGDVANRAVVGAVLNVFRA